jgi:undecaprenyl diphosphate synthase
MTLPRHVAIIMDGNGRWAEARGLPRSSGHQNGVQPVRMCIESCRRHGIEALTLFAFSSENWQRPEPEVSGLMGLFFDALASEVPQLVENGIRLRFIGDRAALDPGLRARMQEAELGTGHLRELSLQIAVSYGGRADIALAARNLAARCESGEMRAASVDEKLFGQQLALADLPEPDLLIRSGGEQRISNFLLWQMAYTELYFTDTLWPDFDANAFELALQAFASRLRRFGLTSAQQVAS